MTAHSSAEKLLKKQLERFAFDLDFAISQGRENWHSSTGREFVREFHTMFSAGFLRAFDGLEALVRSRSSKPEARHWIAGKNTITVKLNDKISDFASISFFENGKPNFRLDFRHWSKTLQEVRALDTRVAVPGRDFSSRILTGKRERAEPNGQWTMDHPVNRCSYDLSMIFKVFDTLRSIGIKPNTDRTMEENLLHFGKDELLDVDGGFPDITTKRILRSAIEAEAKIVAPWLADFTEKSSSQLAELGAIHGLSYLEYNDLDETVAALPLPEGLLGFVYRNSSLANDRDAYVSIIETTELHPDTAPRMRIYSLDRRLRESNEILVGMINDLHTSGETATVPDITLSTDGQSVTFHREYDDADLICNLTSLMNHLPAIIADLTSGTSGEFGAELKKAQTMIHPNYDVDELDAIQHTIAAPLGHERQFGTECCGMPVGH